MTYSQLISTVETAPGRTFRSVNPLVVQSSRVMSFPPRGVLYRVAEPVDFEDVELPGEVAVRILDGRVTVNPARKLELRQPDRIRPGDEEAGR